MLRLRGSKATQSKLESLKYDAERDLESLKLCC